MKHQMLKCYPNTVISNQIEFEISRLDHIQCFLLYFSFFFVKIEYVMLVPKNKIV